MQRIRELNIPRHRPAKRAAAGRVADFDEIDSGFTASAAVVEASRCVQCAEPPCAIMGCPLSNRIPEWLDHVVNGRLRKAAEVLARTSNMPEACGKLCPHEALCELHCVVGRVGEPVSIGRLEEFVAKTARQRGWFRTVPALPRTGGKVAIVGSGPAGLSAAEELLDYGHAVTVFEKRPLPGGLMVFGIPNFKYAKERMDGLLERIRSKGAEFRCGVRVGPGLDIDELLGSQGYDAVLLAVGAEQARRANLPGESLKNVYQAAEFLVRAHVPAGVPVSGAESPVEVGRTCVVIGGGDTAMDCVRTAVRLGYQQVRCVYRRGEQDMPGRTEDRRHAVEEGVRFDYHVAPVEFLSGPAPCPTSDQVTAVRCVRTEPGERDASGRRRPVPVPGSQFDIEADTVVLALGFVVEAEPARSAGISVSDRIIGVNPDLSTNRPGVFAAGDARRGADLIVTAVNDGRRAAAAIDRYIRDLPPR
jgi:glutamate synthase (NADPH/NADH) small chain